MTVSKTISTVACVFCAVMLTVFCSCSSEHTYFHQYQAIDTEGWTADDTIVFHLTPSSVAQTLDAELGVRTTDAFPFNSLFLLGTLCCEGNEVSTDTVFVSIYGRDGIALGDGFPYPTCTCPLPPLQVDSGLNYTYTVTPFMKEPVVVGVKDIGIKLTARD